jgi:hypothetical protein
MQQETTQAPEPQRRLITLRSEYHAAVGELLPVAQRELRIFDPDLSELGLQGEERLRHLHGFLRASRNNRLFIIVHRTDFIMKSAPRLMSLLGTFSGSMFIRQTTGDATRVEDCFFLCDEEHFARRPVWRQFRGTVYRDAPAEGRGVRERFDQIWESSFPGVSATQIGL